MPNVTTSHRQSYKMIVYHGTSVKNLISIEKDGGISGPSYWTNSLEVATEYAQSWGDYAILKCDTEHHEFKANMLVANCLLDNGDIDNLPSENDLLYSLEYLEGIVCHDTIMDYEIAMTAPKKIKANKP